MSNHIDPESENTGFILSRSQYDRGGLCCFDFWIQTQSGVSLLTVTGEKPVCFIRQTDVDSVVTLAHNQALPITSKPLDLKSFDSEPMAALYAPNLATYYKIKPLCESLSVEIFEEDIRPVDRYLMERFVKGSVKFVGQQVQGRRFNHFQNVKLTASDYTPRPMSLLSIDIECNEKGELFSIGLYQGAQSNAPKFAAVLYNTGGMLKSVETLTKDKEVPDFIEWCSDEKSLLKRFCEWVNYIDPDCLVGWNFISFDVRLIDRAAQRNNVKLRIGRDGSALRFSDGKSGHQRYPDRASVAGRVVLDGIDVMKNATYHFASFSLNNVAKEILSDQKIALTDDPSDKLGEIKRLYQQEPIKLAEYNLQDCKLVADIFRQEQLLLYLQTRSRLTGLELDKVGGSVAAFQNLYMPGMHRKGWIAPNLVKLEDYLHSPGGYVMESVPGIHPQVLVFDFKSLYPSIIRTFNIDPVTLIEAPNIPAEQRIPGFRGGEFSREKSLLSDILDELWLAREKAKSEGNKVFSNAIKIIMNSFYGVLGSAGCRFYDTKLASSITMRGHWVLNQTKEWLERQGLKVIYGDTDSVFVSLADSRYSESDAPELESRLNKWWQVKLSEEMNLHSRLELEYENCYQPFFMPTIRGSETGSKKRYAGQVIDADGNKKIVFKGLESVRSDWTPLAKQFQQELYERVFKNCTCHDYIVEILTQLRSGQHDSLLHYRKRIRNDLKSYTKTTPPQIRAAKGANQLLGFNKYGRGDLIEYYISTKGPQSVDFVELYDYEHYVEKQLFPIAESILSHCEPSALLAFDDQLSLL